MAKELRHIPFEEFAADVAGVFNRVVAENEAVVVEQPNGTQAVLKPVASKRPARRRRTISDADYEAFLSSAGGWKDVDTDKLVRDIYESRRQSSRPPVEL
jgi:hypothetical protein